jgi:cell division initiation protein
MDVSPQYLREVVFKEQWRGYNPDEVDDLLERVAAAIETFQDRLRQATERAARAEQRASENADADEALRRTLVLAQRAADLATDDARDEAQAAAIVAEAEAAARRVAAEAERRQREDIAKLEEARATLQADVDALQRYVGEQRTRLRQILQEQLESVQRSLTVPAGPDLHDVDIPSPPYEPEQREEREERVEVVEPVRDFDADFGLDDDIDEIGDAVELGEVGRLAKADEAEEDRDEGYEDIRPAPEMAPPSPTPSSAPSRKARRRARFRR